MYLGTIRLTVVQNRRTSVQKIHTLVQQTAYRLVRTRVPDRPDHPKCLYTQQLAIFKPRLSYFRLLKVQLNRSCLNLICYILWYASNKKCVQNDSNLGTKKLYHLGTAAEENFDRPASRPIGLTHAQ